jgi:hypothetical protein
MLSFHLKQEEKVSKDVANYRVDSKLPIVYATFCQNFKKVEISRNTFEISYPRYSRPNSPIFLPESCDISETVIVGDETRDIEGRTQERTEEEDGEETLETEGRPQESAGEEVRDASGDVVLAA